MERRRKALAALRSSGSSENVDNGPLHKSGDSHINQRVRRGQKPRKTRNQRKSEHRAYSIPVDVEPILLARKHERIASEQEQNPKEDLEPTCSSPPETVLPEANSDEESQSTDSSSEESDKASEPQEIGESAGDAEVSVDKDAIIGDHEANKEQDEVDSSCLESSDLNCEPDLVEPDEEPDEESTESKKMPTEVTVVESEASELVCKEEDAFNEEDNKEFESPACDETSSNKETLDRELKMDLDVSTQEIVKEDQKVDKEDQKVDKEGSKEENVVEESVVEEKNVKKIKSSPNAFSKTWKSVLTGIYALFTIMVNFLFKLHHSALSMLTKNNVAFTVSYIYAFPFIVSSLTDDTTSAPSIIWYTFLIWFFANHRGQNSSGTPPSLNIRLLLPLLFVFEGGKLVIMHQVSYLPILVCNPKFIVLWNGGERLVLAFVLLSMKSNNFLDWSCFASLALLIVTSVVLGANILVQWAILVMALSSLSPSFSLDPLMQNNSEVESTSCKTDCSTEEDHYNPSFEATLLPPATTVGFYTQEESTTKISRTPKRNKRKRN